MQRGVVRLASGTVGYAVAGTGEPLLLLHGWGASGVYWRATAAALGDTRRCYALDLPGFGESPALAAPATLARLADLVVACADALGVAAFDLNGHSFGASVAAYVVARHPERVRRLVLSSFGLPGTTCERQAVALMQPAYSFTLQAWEPWLALMQPWIVAARPWQEAVLSTPPIAMLLASWYMREVPRDPSLLREGIADLVRMDVRAHLASVAAIGDTVLVDSLRQIETPALLIGGRDDRVMPPGAVAAAARLLPHSRVVLLDRCGHLPMIEAPLAYHAALRSFLDA